ncbi:helix-turn-helix domain-containing protein [Marinobacterium arenosum]|uniref:helix-turn-helix domain-containing protein n=1 Tax=Marinobacterium arenosum TaxID=2862496 RepID=UPI001C94719E|nr:helix-turn-helix transcriptional regulator [Marinobacterium arenosum]MBY4675180.1 helix-turn-helix transcriptional regulator [Marinobacterium arenosum]
MDATMDGKVVLDTRKLKARRKQLGYSQEALSYECEKKRLKVSLATLKRAETGKPVTYRTARDLAEFFSLPPTELMAPKREAFSPNRYCPPMWNEVERRGCLPSYAQPSGQCWSQQSAFDYAQIHENTVAYVVPEPDGSESEHGHADKLSERTLRRADRLWLSVNPHV